MLLLALIPLAVAPALDAGARRVLAGDRASERLSALDAWMAVVVSGVVLLDVLPEGIEELGIYAIVVAFVGAVLTSAAHHGGGDRWLGIAALVGLGAHSFLDGVAIESANAASALGIGAAIALHNTPAGVAIWRAAGRHGPPVLALAICATLLGGAAGGFGVATGGPGIAPLLAGIQCFVAGSVLHIATDAAMPRARPPAPTGAPARPGAAARWSAVGALVGAATVGLVCLVHPAEAPLATELQPLPTALALWLEGGPWIFVGLLGLTLAAPRLPDRTIPAFAGVFAAAAWLGPMVTGVQAACLGALLVLRPPEAEGGRAASHDVVAEVAPWLLAGLVAASLVEPWMAQDLARVPVGVQLVTAALLPWFVASPLALAPVAAVLVHKGADPSVAVALTVPALLSPATRIEQLLASAVALAVAALAFSSSVPFAIPDLHASAAHPHSLIEYASGTAVAVLTLAALLRAGLFGFARTLSTAR